MELKICLVLVLQVLGLSLSNADMHSSCFDDMDMCTEHMRTLLTDENMFWFGRRDYLKKCPLDNYSPFDATCANPNRKAFSILSRLYNATDAADMQKYDVINSKVKLAHVEYPAEEGHYYGCGHNFHEPGTAHRLDPNKVTTVNSWTLDLEPHVTWDTDPSDAGAFYTVFVWDVGYYYQHGFYINAQGGDMKSATTIKRYHSAKIPRTSPNVYLFGVFKQTGFINPGTAAGALGRVVGMNQAMVPFVALKAALGGAISDMVAANLLTTVGDAYSMERQKNNYITNGCPWLISQSPALKQILYSANVPASWSEEKVTLDYTEPSYLATLTTDLGVEYSTAKDMVVQSCCVKTTYTKTLYRPDPLGTQLTRPAITSKAPRITISPIQILNDVYDSVKTKTYTLLMVDMADSSSMVAHWIVTDIHDGDVTKGNEVLPYLGPNPIKSDDTRTYVFFLIKQTVDTVDTSNLPQFVSNACPDFAKYRCGFQLSRMMEAWDLKDIAGITWFQAQQDAFARKRLYGDWMYKMMVDVCDGQPGFEDPCPQQQYCPAARANSGPRTTATAGLTTVFVCVFAALYSVVRDV